MERQVFDQVVVVGRVLPGVEDQGETLHTVVAAQRLKPPRQLFHHGRELAHIGAVARVGVADQGDAPVNGDHQAQPNQAQVAAFLFGVAPLGDGGPNVGRVDPGSEVGHVQHQP